MGLSQGIYASDSTYVSKSDSLYSAIKKLPNDTIKVKLINEHGVFILNEDYEEGLALAREALSISDRLDFEKGKMVARFNIGNYYWYNGYYVEAESYFKKALASAQSVGDAAHVAEINNRIGLVHYYQAHYTEAQAFHQKALARYQEIADTLGIAMVQYHIGLLYHQQCAYESAVDYYMSALRLYESQGSSLSQASLLNRLSQVYLDLGQPELVWERKDELLSLASTSDAQANAAEFHEKIGDIFFLLDEYNSAMSHFTQAADEFIESGRTNHYDFVIEKIGKIYVSKGKYDAALDLYLKVKKIREEQGTRIHISSNAGNLGDLFKSKKDWLQALKYYNKALGLHLDMGNALSATQMYTHLAEVYLAIDNIDQAIFHAKKGLENAMAISAKNIEITNLELLSEAYFRQQNYPQAFHYLKSYHERKNDLLKGNTLQKIETLRVNYYEEKNQREVAQLKQKEIQKNAELQQRTLLIIIFSILLISSIIVALLLYSRNKLKNRNNELLQKKNKQLNQKNKEGEILLHEIRHRIKNNLQTISSLLNLHSRQLSDHQKSLIKESNDRLTAIAMVHDKLHHDTKYAMIILDVYLKDLTDNLVVSYGIPNLSVHYQLEPIEVDANSAIHLGIIVNELVTNALKHAFMDQESPELSLTVESPDEEWVTLRVKDNGKGFSGTSIKSESFGVELTSMLVQEMKGDITYQNGQGTEVTVTIRSAQLKPTPAIL